MISLPEYIRENYRGTAVMLIVLWSVVLFEIGLGYLDNTLNYFWVFIILILTLLITDYQYFKIKFEYEEKVENGEIY